MAGIIKRVIFKLLIVLIALLCIDGGMSAGYPVINVHVSNTLHHINDIELPGHNSHSDYDYENWAGSPGIDFSDYSGNFTKIPLNLNPLLSGFHISVWQPPEKS